MSMIQNTEYNTVRYCHRIYRSQTELRRLTINLHWNLL